MSSIQSVHVRFPALLEQPPVDRVRKRGLVYPKLAQSKGSGDRMNSPDHFWASRRVSAVPPGPDPRKAVPQGRSIHLPKPAVTSPGILSHYVYGTRLGGGRRYGASNHVIILIWARPSRR